MDLFVSWAIIFLIIRPEMKRLSATRDQFKSSLESMGKMQPEEKAFLAVLVAAMILWIVPSLLRSSGPLDVGYAFAGFVNAFAANATEAIPALMIMIAIAIMRTGRDKPLLLKWDEMARAVDWNIVLLFGGGLALGMGMESSGLAEWIGIEISSLIRGIEITPLIVFAASAFMGFVISYAASNTADLHLENTGVKLRPDGTIAVNAEMRTSAPHIWGGGDVTTEPMLETKEGATAGENALMRTHKKIDLLSIPSAIFTSP